MSPETEVPAYTIPGEKQFLTRELLAFLIGSLLVSWPIVLLVISRFPPDFRTGDIEAVTNAFGSLPMLFGTGPIISAIVITLIYRGKTGVKQLFGKIITRKIAIKWYLTALLLPVISQWIGLFVWKQLTGTELILPMFTSYLSSWLQIALISTAYYITEEVGWRGFMLPRVLTMNTWIRSSLIVGIIWSFWHFPFWITSSWATSGSVTQVVLMVVASSAFATGLSVMITWIFKNTRGSILPAMLLHGSSQANLTKMYAAAGDSALLGSGFIIVEAATLAIVLVLLLLTIGNTKPEPNNI